MGIRQRWRELWDQPSSLEPARKLDLRTGFNVRELGGYDTQAGVMAYHRFLRSGGLDMLSAQDQQRLHDYGVRLVVDLRGNNEVGLARDKIASMPNVRFKHVPLYDFDLSDPRLEDAANKDGRLTLGYLTMLANRDAVRQIFSFFATAEPQECVLFHCAAGMDRTGVTAMLLLGLAGASRERIVADYCYSFASERQVDAAVFRGAENVPPELDIRMTAMDAVLNSLEEAYGTARDYLLACGVTPQELECVRAHLVD